MSKHFKKEILVWVVGDHSAEIFNHGSLTDDLVSSSGLLIQIKYTEWQQSPSMSLVTTDRREQRLVVHGVLEQLRQQGWLERFTPFVESEAENSTASPSLAEAAAN